MNLHRLSALLIFVFVMSFSSANAEQDGFYKGKTLADLKFDHTSRRACRVSRVDDYLLIEPRRNNACSLRVISDNLNAMNIEDGVSISFEVALEGGSEGAHFTIHTESMTGGVVASAQGESYFGEHCRVWFLGCRSRRDGISVDVPNIDEFNLYYIGYGNEHYYFYMDREEIGRVHTRTRPQDAAILFEGGKNSKLKLRILVVE